MIFTAKRNSMTSTVVLLVVMFVAVEFGIIYKKWAFACSMLVLHIAIGSVVVCCVSDWNSENQSIASPSRRCNPASING